MTKIIIYTKDNCPYCVWAKNFLDQKKLAYDEVRVDLDTNQLQYMIEKSGRRTVPQIFINDQPIGGYDDLVALENAGELDKLIS